MNAAKQSNKGQKSKQSAVTKTKGPAKRKRNTTAAAVTAVTKSAPSVSDLDSVVQDITRRLDALDEGDREATLSNYEIGEAVKEVTDDPAKFGFKPGEQVVKRIAERVGKGKDTIYNGLKVADAWPREEFTQWRMRKGSEGFFLSFAHFVEIQKLDGDEKRREMLEHVLNDGLSTRALRKLCKKPVGNGTPLGRRISGKRLLEAIIRHSEKCITLFELVPDALASFDGKGVADPPRLIDRAQELQHNVKELCEKNVKALAAKFNAFKLVDGGVTETKATVGEKTPNSETVDDEQLKPEGGNSDAAPTVNDARDEEARSAIVVQLPILGASTIERETSAAGGAA